MFSRVILQFWFHKPKNNQIKLAHKRMIYQKKKNFNHLLAGHDELYLEFIFNNLLKKKFNGSKTLPLRTSSFSGFSASPKIQTTDTRMELTENLISRKTIVPKLFSVK